ncbi:hypothetical protein [Emticicia fontis]
MPELIHSINEIAKFGLHPNLNVADKELFLEKHLVTIYKLYFGVEYEFDHHNYPEFDKSTLPDIRKNVESNFQGFGYYKTVIDINNTTDYTNIGLGDAIDDLTDIIIDLLEVTWRIENNSLNDGLYYFKTVFHFHTQQHILDLLNFMKQREG